MWEDNGDPFYVSSIEQKLQCCGYDDNSLSVSDECYYSITCGSIINIEKQYRIQQFLSYLGTSFLFQIYHFYSCFTVFYSPSKNEVSEFDDLIESIN